LFKVQQGSAGVSSSTEMQFNLFIFEMGSITWILHHDDAHGHLLINGDGMWKNRMNPS
jgi:hypothetical protein